MKILRKVASVYLILVFAYSVLGYYLFDRGQQAFFYNQNTIIGAILSAWTFCFIAAFLSRLSKEGIRDETLGEYGLACLVLLLIGFLVSNKDTIVRPELFGFLIPGCLASFALCHISMKRK